MLTANCTTLPYLLDGLVLGSVTDEKEADAKLLVENTIKCLKFKKQITKVNCFLNNI